MKHIVLLSAFLCASSVFAGRIVTGTTTASWAYAKDRRVLNAVWADAQAKCGYGYEAIAISESRQTDLKNGYFRLEVQFECVGGNEGLEY